MKRILLVADEMGWIFENHCKEIKSRLTEYSIDIVFHNRNIVDLSKGYDLVYILDPMPLSHGYPPASKAILGLRNQFLYEEHAEGAVGLYKNGFPGRCVSIQDKCSIFHVVNKNQMKIFEKVVLDKPLVLAQHGVNEDLFDCKKYQRLDSSTSRVRVGLAGRNSRNKAFDAVKSICEKLDYEVITASYGRNQKSKELMPLFYTNIDIYVNFSQSEGQNNGIMEAGAMGIPVIATKTGAAPEMIVDGESGYLINRTEEDLRSALLKLKDEQKRIVMGRELCKEINKNWTWKVRVNDFRKMFNLYFEGTKV